MANPSRSQWGDAAASIPDFASHFHPALDVAGRDTRGGRRRDQGGARPPASDVTPVFPGPPVYDAPMAGPEHDDEAPQSIEAMREEGVPLSSLFWFRLGRLRVIELVISGILLSSGVERFVEKGAADWWGWVCFLVGLMPVLLALVMRRNPLGPRPSPLNRGALRGPVTRTNIWAIIAVTFALAMVKLSERPVVAIGCGVLGLACSVMSWIQFRRSRGSTQASENLPP
jgi:hypothetical protein